MSDLWRYYRTSHGRGKWQPCPEDQVEEILESTALHMTALALDQQYVEGMDPDELKYLGDLVIDIDNSTEYKNLKGEQCTRSKEDALRVSIASANKMVDQITEYCDPTLIQIFASGGKGFHICIPWQLMMGKKRKAPIRRLNKIYKKIVRTWADENLVDGVDTGMYAGGRGHMVRVPNKQREDGAYKVQVSCGELRTMTPDKYIELCSGPRPLLNKPNLDSCIGLRALFDETRKNVDDEEANKATTQYERVSSEMLEGFGSEHHPECIKRLIYYKHKKKEISFHSVALQLATYIHETKVSEQDTYLLVSTMAEKGESGTYKCAEARTRHVIQDILPYSKGMGFSCAGMRSVVDLSDGACSKCPVQIKFEEEISNQSGIEEDDEGYFVAAENGARRKIANFTLTVKNFILPEGSTGRMDHSWIAADISLYARGEFIGKSEVSHEVFQSVKEFRKFFSSMYREAMIRASDTDIDQLRWHLMKMNSGMVGVLTVPSVGLRRMKFIPEGCTEEIEDTVWVEQGWRISASGSSGGARTTKPINKVISYEKSTSPLNITKECNDVLWHLLHCAEDHVIGTLLGWVGASQTKELTFSQILEFPLLNIRGEAGSGKTSLATIFSYLGGADYSSGVSVYSTKAPMKITAAETTSIPRIFDECGSSKMVPAVWLGCLEVLKACYQQSDMEQGTIAFLKKVGTTDNVIKKGNKASAPIIYLSTSSPTEAELWERTVDIPVFKSTHFNKAIKEHYDIVWSKLESKERLKDVGKLMMMTALNLSVTKAMDIYNKHYSWAVDAYPKLNTRGVKSQAYIFAGLEFVRKVFAMGGSEELLARLDEITEVTRNYHIRVLGNRKDKTEMGMFFNTIVATAAMFDTQGQPLLRPFQHYIRKDHNLYLNIDAVFSVYLNNCSKLSSYREYSNVEQWKQSIIHKSYYLGVEMLPEADGSLTPWEKIDIRPLEEDGNDFSRFKQ